MYKRIFGIMVLYILFTGTDASTEEQTLPPAQEIMAKVAETYRAPQRYFMSGTVSAKLRQYPSGLEPTPVAIAAEFPDQFRMEGDLSALGLKGITLIILDGKDVWIYDKNSRQYFRIPRASKPGAKPEKAEYGRLDFSKPEQVVPYFDNYLFIRYRGAYRPISASAILGVEIVKTKDEEVPCYVVQIDHGDFDAQKPGSGRNTWWVDKNSFRVWKEINATWSTVKPAFLESQTTVFDTIFLDEPLPDETFVFKPPKGSKQASIPKR